MHLKIAHPLNRNKDRMREIENHDRIEYNQGKTKKRTRCRRETGAGTGREQR